MANIMIAIGGACLVICLYIFGLKITDKKYELLFIKKNHVICERVVYGIGILTGAGWAVIYLTQKSAMSMPEMILSLCLVCEMSVLAVIDWKSRKVPNRILKDMLFVWIVVITVCIILNTAHGVELFFRSIAGAAVGGAIFLLCYILSHKQLGAGDVKLAFVMGLYLTGQRIVGAIFYGVGLCCVYSLIQMCRKKVGMKDEMPLVPFLHIGVLAAIIIL